MIPGTPAPLDPTGQPADADLERAREYLRRKMAEAMHPSRRRLLERELADMERRAA